MTWRKKQADAFHGTAVTGAQALREGFAEITSGSRSEKLGRGGTDDELAKPLIVIQRVQIPPDQSRADRSVVSLAIHRATGLKMQRSNVYAVVKNKSLKGFS